MRLSVNKKILESTLSLCNSYTDKKDASNIASCFLLSASKKELIIKANDYEIGINYKLKKVEIENEGKACVNAKKLLDIIKVLKNELIKLELEKDYLVIKQAKTKYKLAIFKDENFADFPDTKNKNKFDINSDVLNRSLAKILAPIDINHQRYSLRGAFLDIKKDYINFVSTDTKRLAVYTLEKESEKEFSLCIPKKAILAMKDLFFEDKKVEIFYDSEILIAKSDKFEFYTKLINDTFPNYEKIIPKSSKENFSFNTDNFKESLRLISVTSDEIKLAFFKDKLIFQSKSDANTEAKHELEIALNIEENFEIAFKIKFLMDFLNTIENEEFNFAINEPDLAFVVSSGHLRTIIAPMMV